MSRTVPVLLRVVLAASSLALAPNALARDVPVATSAELRSAVEGALPGDVILVADGTYDVTGNLGASAAGTAESPIVVRAVTPLGAHVRFDALEGFFVTGPHWTFEDLDIEGVCADHGDCEHAFHVVGAADSTVIRNNRVHGFNAHIKGNGVDGAWPDDVVIEGNELFNEAARMTSSPVTPIDVVGGRRWIVRGNFIHDHHKGGGNGISYAAFLKGNSRDGVIERNLVVCELLHTGGIRLGLSFGGGGSSPDPICEDGTCSPEHQGGVMRNNVIVACPADVGIYVNECASCRVLHNTLFGTTGIDVRFAASSVEVSGNLLSGRVRARDGATLDASGNLEMVSDAEFEAWFEDPAAADFTLVDGSAIVDQGASLVDVTDDFCGNERDDGLPDLGAVEYDGDTACDTTMPGGAPPTPDAGSAMPDAGSASPDGGTSSDGGNAMPDGGISSDGGSAMPDAGTSSDGGSVSPDAGASSRADGGATPSDDVDGCSCHAADRRPDVLLGALVPLLALALVRRRRRA